MDDTEDVVFCLNLVNGILKKYFKETNSIKVAPSKSYLAKYHSAISQTWIFRQPL